MATINGTNLNDSLVGTTGNDSISGFGGDDTLTGREGADTLLGGADDDSLLGDAGNDSLLGEAGGDTGFGGAGNDTLDGGSGRDLLYGGADNDLVSGGTDRDTLHGDAGDDSLFGGDAQDLLYGGDGSDLLDAGTGGGSLYGGNDNDTLIGSLSGDGLYGGEDLDVVDYSRSNAAVRIDLNANTASGGHAANDSLGGIDGIIGSGFNDTLLGFDQSGTSGADLFTNVLYGAGGNDSIDGRGGDDSLFGGTGNDTVFGGTGNDTLAGEDGSDRLFGGDGQDLLTGGDGADSLQGDAGNDTLQGDAGNDTLNGGTGSDSLFGGDDQDSMLGGSGDDRLEGGAGNDTLIGEDGADVLLGGAGSDTLYAGAGADTLNGGTGADGLYGGNDADLFRATTRDEAVGDTVFGGTGGLDQDRLDLTGTGPRRIVYTSADRESGYVEFLGPGNTVLGRLDFFDIETVVPCFTPGTRIATEAGPVDVAALRVGMRVMTRDHGLQPLRWVGRRDLGRAALMLRPELCPVRIPKGALGAGLPERDLVVSPQHRMLVEGPRAEMMFADAEVLVAATHLVGRGGIARLPCRDVSYLHLLLDRHEIILAEGAWTESFQPAAATLGGMAADQRDEILSLFPDLAGRWGSYAAARPTLRAHEARVLLAA